MQRIPEPELMDSEAQTLAYAQSDFSESNQMFVDLLLARFTELPTSGIAWDLGCGPADITIRLAAALPGWKLTGVDAGANMLQRAHEALRDSPQAPQISLQQSYLPDPDLPAAHCDLLLSNSLLHHLPDPDSLWQSIRHLGKSGARVMVMDLYRPANTNIAESLVEEYTADAPEVLKTDFYNSLLAAWTVEEIAQQLKQNGLSQLHLETPSDRHWLVSGTLT